MNANANAVVIQTIKLENEVWERFERNGLTDLISVQHLKPKSTWDDIVLPFGTLDLPRQIGDQVRHRVLMNERWGFHTKVNRSLGNSALSVGENSTGKTMAA